MECQNCKTKPFKYTPQDIVDAEGFIACEICEYPIKPSDEELNRIAADVAFSSLLGVKLAHKPSEWLIELRKRRDDLLAE